MQRHWFPGGNTARGFHSFYQYIMPPEEATRVIILKGGPGVGKSTFMRRMAEMLEDHGQMIEYLHCSSDNDSLDGVVCRAIGFAMLDGTAPHIVDPEMPGAADSILNLGVFLDETGLSLRKSEILSLKQAISVCFNQAYRYLQAALPLREDSAYILRSITDEAALMRQFAPWLETVTAYREPTKPGRSRPMFASAITPQGCVNYLETLAVPRIWRVAGEWGMDSHKLLSCLRHAALLRGMDVEAMYCPLQPERLEHLYIPVFGLLITSENRYHALDAPAERTISYDALRLRAPGAVERDALTFNGEQFDRTIEAACESIRRAKALHDELEVEYISRMDFDGVERCWQETSGKVIELIPSSV
ncbi:MAG: ATPase [Firmicutes bacterium]|nr:ATPase [Bacillota bacterium]